MKKSNRILSGVLSFCLLFTLFLQLFSPVVSYASDETIYINNTSEFIDFAKKCSYDAWSVGKTVILTKDISLSGTDFSSIPTFSGVFDGQNHVINGFNPQGAFSPCGLFSSLGKEGVIKNLTVTGSVAPDGDKNLVGGIVGDNAGKIDSCIFIGTVMGKTDVGGIAGINRLSGSITNCQVGGNVIGEERTGGIAGSNAGLISSCSNSSQVNTISVTPSLSLEEINVSLTLDITKLPLLSNLTMTDTGGISGYSTGMIIGSTNNGRVGYPHVGYNAGGIVGRSSGHLNGNINKAEVYGRKDVGGIVGQMEPYISYQLSEDLLASLKAELDELSAVVSGAVENADGGIPTISGRLNSILNNIDDATDSLDTLIGDVTDYGDGFIGEINRISAILSKTLSQIGDIGKNIPELTEILSKALEDLEKGLEGLDEVATLGAKSIADLIMVAQDASKAFDKISDSIEKIDGGITALEGSVEISDKEAAKSALDSISVGLSDLIYASEEMSTSIGSVAEVLGNAVWAKDAVSQIISISEVFAEIASAFSDIYDATVVIDENIDIYWDKIKEGGDELVHAFGCFSKAMTDMTEALDLMDSGLGNIIEGLEGLYSSVKINDAEAVKEATAQILEGFNSLVEASAKGSAALSELADALKEVEDEDLSEIFAKISETLNVLSETGTEATEAVAKLTDGMSVILDNIEIDFDLITDSGALIIGGAGDLTDALRKMRSAIKTMTEGTNSLYSAVIAIKEAVVIKDEQALEAAFTSAYDAVGRIANSVEELSSIMTEAAKTLEEARVWGQELTSKIKDVTDAFSSVSAALIKVQGGIDSLRSNISFDASLADEGITLIRMGLLDISEASEHIKNALVHLADSFTDLEGAMNGVGSVAFNFAKAVSTFADGAEIITDMSEKINKLLGYLNGVDGVQLPTPPESITATANKLFISISAIENELKYLNADLTDLSIDLVQRIGKINQLFEEMSENIVDMIYGLTDGSIIDNNVTEEEIDSVTNGKIFSCHNYGSVYGDINVGGISGAMGLEYSLDPEDDLSGELSVTQKKQYRMKAVIHACRNYGSVTSKRDSVGGICGKMDFGLIYGCESYCQVQSEAGGYVGGIAGITAGLISGSFAKCSLSGGKYVGGIVGSGVTEDYSGDSSMVRDCYAMVEILRYTQYAGAIAGVNIGQYSENLFISDTLAGIDRVSYLGKAEPISYEDLIKRRSIPEGFYSFVLKFVADGVVLSTVEFDYGESFDNSVFPEIPKKQGHYGYWDMAELTNLVFDTTVNAIYKPYTTALGGEIKRENGKEIFFVRGEFTENDSVSVKEGANTSALTLLNKFFTKDTLVESWTINIPLNNLETNTIHFLPASEHCRIFVKADGEWRECDVTEFGSYLTFEVSDERIEVAIIEHTVKILPIIIISFVLLVGVTVAVVLIVVNKKKCKAQNESSKKEEKEEEEEEEEVKA